MRSLRSFLLLALLLFAGLAHAQADPPPPPSPDYLVAHGLPDGGTALPDAVALLDGIRAVDRLDAAHAAGDKTAEHIEIAALLAIVFKFAIEVLEALAGIGPRAKRFIPWACMILGVVMAVLAKYAHGSTWLDAVIVGGAGPGAVLVNELVNTLKKPPVPLTAVKVPGAVAVLTLLVLGTSCAGFRLPTGYLAKAERDSLGCAAQAVQAEMQSVGPAVINALAGVDAQWEKQLTALEVNGGAAVVCEVAHLVWDAIGGHGAEPTPAAVAELMMKLSLVADNEDVALAASTVILNRGARYLHVRMHEPKPLQPSRK